LSSSKKFKGKNKNTKNKPIRILYSSLFAKGRSNNIKKISNLNWSINIFELDILQTKLLFLMKLVPFSNLFTKLLRKLALIKSQSFYNFDALLSLNPLNFKFNLSFIYLYLNSFSYLRYNRSNFLSKRFNSIVGYFNCLGTPVLRNSFISLGKNVMPVQKKVYLENKFKLQPDNYEINKYFLLNKNLMLYRKSKKFSGTKLTSKKKNPYSRINYKKLSEIKFLALDRKFKRWNDKTQMVF